MGSRFYSVVIDSEQPATLARWWAEVLAWQVIHDDGDEVTIADGEDAEPVLVFVPVPERKGVKNRLHLDLAPDDQDAEVERIVALGGRRVDVGQGDARWVVLADPEGNEFCVLTAR